MNLLEKSIGRQPYHIIEIGKDLLSEEQKIQYTFLSEEDFKNLLKENLSEGMRIYWLELFYRCHMGAYGGLKRLLSWVDIVENSNNNYISYCSGLRGLMECCGDTYHGLSQLAITLGDNKKMIKEALDSKSTELCINSEFEEMIIHFTHASKTYSKVIERKEYKPKQSLEYVKLLEKGSSIKFYDYYSFLCELTHPASISLAYNFEDINGKLIFNPNRDTALVSSAFKTDSVLISELLVRGFNPIILLIKTINLFSLPDLYSKKADSVVLDNPAWKRILK